MPWNMCSLLGEGNCSKNALNLGSLGVVVGRVRAIETMQNVAALLLLAPRIFLYRRSFIAI